MQQKSFIGAIALVVAIAFAIGVRFFPEAEAQVGSVAATPDQGIADLKKRVETFFSDLDGSSTGSSSAFEKLFRRGPLEGTGTSENAAALKSRFETVAKRFGPYLHCESIAEKTVGSDLVILRYLYKCEKCPVVWHFTFYRSPAVPTDWFVVDVRFDTNLSVLML